MTQFPLEPLGSFRKHPGFKSQNAIILHHQRESLSSILDQIFSSHLALSFNYNT
jgi:hypothetical protein